MSELPVCNDFVYGRCKDSDCKFAHDDTICFHYWKRGSCKWNEECKYKHVANPTPIKRVNIVKHEEDNREKRKDKNRDKREMRANGKERKDAQRPPITGRNTVSWTPMTEPCDMRVVFDLGKVSCTTQLTTRDVLLVPNLFSDYKSGEIFNALMKELELTNVSTKKWHGNDKIDGTHYIVDDRANSKWKDAVPTFGMVVEKIRRFFQMQVAATRLNIYHDNTEWKPFHHDSAAVDASKADKQNFTVAISFGATRVAAFEHAKKQSCTIAMPQDDGVIYCFSKDTNIIWRHGILKEEEASDKGRISIILWGWVEGMK